MRHISNRDVPALEAMQREAARRAFARADDIDAEVAKFKVDVVDAHIRALVDRITSDPMRREATRLNILKSAEELAGGGASAVVRELATCVAILVVEVHVAGRMHLEAVGAGRPPCVVRELHRWYSAADLRLNAKVKTLAHIRNMESSALMASLAELRMVG